LGGVAIHCAAALDCSFHFSPARLGLFSAVMGLGFVLGYARAKLWLAHDGRVDQ
jgi:hypothetical protein